jgi:hypothetical protein
MQTAPDTDSKRCSECGLTKPVSAFNHEGRNHDGLASGCRDCTNARVRAWRQGRSQVCACGCGGTTKGGRFRRSHNPRSNPAGRPSHLTVDCRGQRFGRLVVVERAEVPRGRRRQAWWRCRCDCGNTTVVLGQRLRNGHTTSCGCLQQESRTERILHGHGRKDRHDAWEYKVWAGMKDRCFHGGDISYPNYGGRGITVREEWMDFEVFLAYLDATIGPHPGKGWSIDRIDNDGNYEPGNIRWATASEQNRNKRRRVA